MSVAQATHQEVLATKMLRNDQNENLGAERFCRRKKQKRGQRSGNQRSRDHAERPGSGLGSDSGSVIFQLCGLEQVPSTLRASVSSSENPSCYSYKRENYGNNLYLFGIKVRKTMIVSH